MRVKKIFLLMSKMLWKHMVMYTNVWNIIHICVIQFFNNTLWYVWLSTICMPCYLITFCKRILWPGVYLTLKGLWYWNKVSKEKKNTKKKQKKKQADKKSRGRGLQYLFWFSMVEIYFRHWNSFTDNIFYKYDILRRFLKTKTQSRFS